MHMRLPRYVNSDYCFARWRGDEVVCQDFTPSADTMLLAKMFWREVWMTVMNHFPSLVQHSTTAFEHTMTTTSLRTQCDNCTNKRAARKPRSLHQIARISKLIANIYLSIDLNCTCGPLTFPIHDACHNFLATLIRSSPAQQLPRPGLMYLAMRPKCKT